MPISRLLANRLAQEGLRKLSKSCQRMQGFGVGGKSHRSGELKVVADFFRPMTKSPVIFDVGANTGQFSQGLRGIDADGGFVVHAFEPSGAAFEKLQSALGDDPRFKLNQSALGAKRGSATLYANQLGSQLASLHKRQLDHLGLPFDASETVPVDTIDEYCKSHEIDEIDLLKVDVEGHELEVFRGAETMIGSGKVRRVMFEFGGCNIDSRTYFRDFYHFFQQANMTLHRIHASGKLLPVLTYRESLECFSTTNYVAKRADC